MKTLKPWQIAALLGSLAALVVVVKYGVGAFPSWVYLYDIGRNWRDPSVAPLMSPPADYLQPNFALAWVAGVFNLLSASSYFVFHLAFALIAVMLPFWMTRVREQPATARLIFIVIAGGPLAAILVMWANGYDALTVIGMTIGALARRPWFAAIGWLLAAINHPIVGVLGFAAWAVILLVRPAEPQRWWRMASSGASVGLGWWANERIMQQWGGYTSRTEWRELVGLGGFWDLLWPAMPLVLFGSVGIGWLLLLHPQARSRLWVRVMILQAVIGPVIVSGLTLDSTRVSALILFAPLLLTVTALSSELGESITADMWRWWAIAAVIVPIPLLFSGEIYHLGWTGFAELDSTLQPPEGYELLR